MNPYGIATVWTYTDEDRTYLDMDGKEQVHKGTGLTYTTYYDAPTLIPQAARVYMTPGAAPVTVPFKKTVLAPAVIVDGVVREPEKVDYSVLPVKEYEAVLAATAIAQAEVDAVVEVKAEEILEAEVIAP